MRNPQRPGARAALAPNCRAAQATVEPLEPRQFLSVTAASPALPHPAAHPAAVVQATPPFHARDFTGVRRINNPFLPLIPGTTFVYEGTQDGQLARNVTTVTHRTRRIDHVRVTVVRDSVFLSGNLIETTDDFYAQDRAGNVWYFGENSRDIQNGKIVSTEGSWRAGVHGAAPGIVMEAHPNVGDAYQQEFATGVAEDRAGVLSLTATATVPFATFNNMLQTNEFTPLEPGVAEHKLYARGIGFVESDMVQGGQEVFRLVDIQY